MDVDVDADVAARVAVMHMVVRVGVVVLLCPMLVMRPVSVIDLA